MFFKKQSKVILDNTPSEEDVETSAMMVKQIVRDIMGNEESGVYLAVKTSKSLGRTLLDGTAGAHGISKEGILAVVIEAFNMDPGDLARAGIRLLQQLEKEGK